MAKRIKPFSIWSGNDGLDYEYHWWHEGKNHQTIRLCDGGEFQYYGADLDGNEVCEECTHIITQDLMSKAYRMDVYRWDEEAPGLVLERKMWLDNPTRAMIGS